MPLQKVMVGHPGDVVANDPVHGLMLRLVEVKGWQASRVFQVVPKEAANTAGEPLPLGIHALMRVKASIEKFLHPLILPRHLPSQRYQTRAASTDLPERLDTLPG